jgi:hypothetical protein
MTMKAAHRMMGATGTITGERQAEDFYTTPPEAVRALVLTESAARRPIPSLIWEPACGRGDISLELGFNGYMVISSDLVDRGYGEPGVDFLKASELLAQGIVTNPPYSHAAAFCRHALELGAVYVAMLLRVTALAGKERGQLYADHPLARVLVISDRIATPRNGAPQKGGGVMDFAWFIWDRRHAGPPALEFVTVGDFKGKE